MEEDGPQRQKKIGQQPSAPVQLQSLAVSVAAQACEESRLAIDGMSCLGRFTGDETIAVGEAQ